MTPLSSRLGRGGRAGAVWVLLVWLAALAPLVAAAAAAAPEAASPSHLFRWRPFLAPFHAVVLHFPIGFVTIAAILEVYRVWRPSEDLRRVTVLILWLSLVSGIVAAMFGTMRAGSGGYEPKMLELHRVYGMAVPLLTVLTLALQKIAFRSAAGRGWTLAYRGFLGLTTTLLVVAGHYGGNLTHGSHYLTENAPAFVRDLFDEEWDAASPAESAGGETNLSPGLRLFVDKVRPVFEAKCVRCHGPEKQKGDYRLDQTETALKGGESGRVAIKPGEPMESHLVRLVLLPRDDDSVMPPSGKEPLTAEETLSVIRWIQQGAPFPAGHTATNRLADGVGGGVAGATHARP